MSLVNKEYYAESCWNDKNAPRSCRKIEQDKQSKEIEYDKIIVAESTKQDTDYCLNVFLRVIRPDNISIYLR